ncbi:MAG: single-stranded DNA-binding protein [Spirosomataceae bacterium]
MASLNKVMLIGNLGNDPEIRTLPSGGKVASFSIATSEAYTNKSGERVENTEWHRIELWDSLAGIAEQYLKKGDAVYVEGRIRTEKWTDQSGQERYTTKIRANGMQLLGSRGGGNSGGGDSAPAYSAPSAPKASGPASAPAPEFATGGGDDDLPF